MNEKQHSPLRSQLLTALSEHNLSSLFKKNNGVSFFQVVRIFASYGIPSHLPHWAIDEQLYEGGWVKDGGALIGWLAMVCVWEGPFGRLPGNGNARYGWSFTSSPPLPASSTSLLYSSPSHSLSLLLLLSLMSMLQAPGSRHAPALLHWEHCGACVWS